MEQLRNYIVIPADLLNCVSELCGDKLFLNHLFWNKFCTSHNTTTNNYVIHIIFRKMLNITYIKNDGSISDNYVWDNKRNSYVWDDKRNRYNSTPIIWNN